MPRTLALLLGLGCAVAAGCERAPPAADSEPAPTSLRGAVVIEPPRLTVGDVATVEITLVTPPGHSLRPVRPPSEVDGFWLLDSRALPVTRSPSRWVHRTQMRARAREPGEYTWPALRVEVETPEQGVVELLLEARPLEVTSVGERFPRRAEPFPLRGARSSEGGAFLMPFAGGVALTLGAVALMALVRRLRRPHGRSPETTPREAHATPRWRAAQATIETALETCGGSPERAADAASAALRHFFSYRFAVSARTLTTEELVGLAPPLGAEKYWPALLEILEALDAVRFRPGMQGAALRETLEGASALVAAAAPEARWR
jgi:hypothetical protein